MKKTVRQLFIYPIKGLTPQVCSSVHLQVGHGIAGDRAFALMFDEGQIQDQDLMQIPWMKKQNFAVQNDWPALANLDCTFQPETQELTVQSQGKVLIKGNLKNREEREQLSCFFTGYLVTLTPTKTARHPEKFPLKLVGSDTHQTRYQDRHHGHLSLISQATLDDLSQSAQQPIDIRRFRPNILLDGLSAWQEFELIGKTFQFGQAQIKITARIGRCNNIEVNPDTALQDLPLLSILKQSQGHIQTGVLAEVLEPGTVQIGSELG